MRIFFLALLTTWIACGWQLAAAGTAAPEEYSIVQTAPSLGSSIKREIIRAGTVPINRPYADFTADEKARLMRDYWQLKPGDEPPFPSNGLMPILQAVQLAYEKTLLQAHGPLVLSVEIDEKGHANGFVVRESPDPLIAEAAAVALMGQTYKPGTINGKPSVMRYAFHVELVGPRQDLAPPTLQKNNPNF
jgi:hypothetical protein